MERSDTSENITIMIFLFVESSLENNKELRSFVKLSELVKSVTKMITGCLTMIKLAIFVV